MRIAFDTSALAKRYIEERGTARVAELCAGAEEVVVSVLCAAEMISGMNRLRREGFLSSRKYAALKKELAADLAQAAIAQITPEAVAGAVDILEQTSLRTLDALHVAAAIDKQCDLFVSADAAQCEAAEKLGLTTERIG
ncbi:MAG: type II toxin-antitoxin system VapC family toxin [Pirellulales bacterium]|nr:type II toxin-antitoxin system VapC family toxin [Pirellulales bacterium]